MGLEEKGAHNVIGSANETLRLAILGRCMWTRKRYTMPLAEKKERREELMNSPPLSHCMALIITLYWVWMKVKKHCRPVEVSDLLRMGNDHE